MEAQQQPYKDTSTGSIEHHLKQARQTQDPECFIQSYNINQNHTGQASGGAPSQHVCCPMQGYSASRGCSEMKMLWTVDINPVINCNARFTHCDCKLTGEPICDQTPCCTECFRIGSSSAVYLTGIRSSTILDTKHMQEEVVSPEQSEEGEGNTLFHLLPWYDVIFTQLCRCLSLQDVFRLRATCRLARDCIDEYFTMCPYVNLTQCGQKVTPSAFRMVTYNNYKLHTLILRGVKFWLTDDVLIPAFASSSHLTKVDLTDCSSLTPRSVVALVLSACTLRELRLRECGWVTKESVLTVAQCCPALLLLDLTGCWAVDDETVVAISVSCQQLVSLSISKIYGITDFSVRHISQYCPQLQHVNMQGCWRVTNAAVHLLGEHCKQLRALQVKECREVTESSLARLRKRGVIVDVPNPNRLFSSSSRSLMERLKLQV